MVIDIDVIRKPFRWRRYLQFRLRSALLVMFACCLAVHFGPAAWRWAFPPKRLPSHWYLGGAEYRPPGPEFNLAREAAMNAHHQERDGEKNR